MSVQSEVSRLETAKSDLASAITAKGVTVPGTTKLDGYAALVEQIEAGGGGGAYDIVSTDNGDGTQSLAIADAAGGGGGGSGDALLNSVIEDAIEGTLTCTAARLRDYALAYLNSVTVIKLPLATTISINAMCGSRSLTTVDFGSVTELNNNVFSYSRPLETVIIRSPAVCTLINANAFYQTKIYNGEGYIYVPAALTEQYKAATNWTTYSAQFRAIEEYPEITGGV